MSDETKISKAKRCRIMASEFMEWMKPKTILFWHGKWYQFNGLHYKEVEDMAILLRQYCLAEGREATRADIGEMEDVLRGGRAVESEMMPPLWRGEQRSNPDSTIAFNNGLLDMDNAKIIPLDSQYFNLHCLPYDYQKDATCPQWLEYLTSILGVDEINLLQEFFGYCLAGMQPIYQKFLMLSGPPRAGKGTISDILGNVIGSASFTGLSMSDLANQFGCSQLENAKVCLIDEINLDRYGKERILEQFNRIVGQGTIKIERKGETPFSAQLNIRFLLLCNKVPQFFEPTGSFASRLLYIQLKKSFMGREDTELKSRLLTELPGICNWAIEGLKRLNNNKKFTATASENMERIRRDASDAYAFACDCLAVSKDIDTGGLGKIKIVDGEQILRAIDLKRMYEQWMTENDRIYDPNHYQGFCSNLRALIPGIDNPLKKSGGIVQRVWIGIGVLPSAAGCYLSGISVDEMGIKVTAVTSG